MYIIYSSLWILWILCSLTQVVNLLQPPTVKAVAALCMVRNSVGENSYVSDEVITAKSGTRVRIGNTDAEGRLVMADALCHIKEMALCSVNPHIFTVATLTYHAILTAGRGYSVSTPFFCHSIKSFASRERFPPRKICIFIFISKVFLFFSRALFLFYLARV